MLISKRIYQQYVANKDLTPTDIAKLCECHENVIETEQKEGGFYYKFSDDSVICVFPHCIHSFENDQSRLTQRHA